MPNPSQHLSPLAVASALALAAAVLAVGAVLARRQKALPLAERVAR